MSEFPLQPKHTPIPKKALGSQGLIVDRDGEGPVGPAGTPEEQLG